MSGLSLVRWQNLLFSAILTALCIVLGWYSQQYYKQWDLTAQSRHSLSESSKAVLRLLNAPVYASIVMGPEKSQRDAVSTLFEKYQNPKPDIFLEFINPETQPQRVEDLKANPAGEVILNYKGQEQRLRTLSERSLSNALQHLARPSKRKVLFISGHRERKPGGKSNGDYAELTSRLGSIGFSIDTISLVSQPTIPDDTDLVVIAAPRDQYFPGEVASILNYIGRGGNLLWLREPDQTDTGLKALEIELGVSALPGIIVDANTRLFNIESPTFTVINEYAPNPVIADFSNITLFPTAMGLEVLPMQDQSIRPLLQTGSNSWTETGPIEGNISYDENSVEKRGPLLLGVSIDRDRGFKNQRILVIGDADFLANTWLGNGGNQMLAERIYNWLGSDDNMLEFTSPIAADKKVTITTSALLSMAGIYLMIIPLAMFSLAFINWRKLRKG